jgi:hypothetical protein
MAETVSGPDFLCIGQQKAGTTWLYDQLAAHPSFWMPPVKELHYFNKGLRPRARSGKSERPGEEQRRKRDVSPPDQQFAEAAQKVFGTSFDFPGYRALFAPKGALISGDITPGYSVLDRSEIDRIAAALPDAKILLLVRDPLQRLWSMFRMQVAQKDFDAAVLQDWSQLKTLIEKKGTRTRSFATRLWKDWTAAAGPERVSFYFFDDIAAEPARVRAAIIDRLGGDPAQPSAIPLDYNRHVFGEKLPMTDTIRGHLVSHFREELLAGAEIFGGHAKEWARRYGL